MNTKREWHSSDKATKSRAKRTLDRVIESAPLDGADKTCEALVLKDVADLCQDRGIDHPRSRAWLEKVFGTYVITDSGTRQKLMDRLKSGAVFNRNRFISMKPGEVFSLKSCIKSPLIRESQVYDALVEWRPSHLTGDARSVGCHEAFLNLMIPGSSVSVEGGDLYVPKLGNIEIKSTKDAYHSCAQFMGMKSDFYGSSAMAKRKIREICGHELGSFADKNLRAFFAEADDTDVYGTAIAEAINAFFLQAWRASDVILTQGFVKRLRLVATTGDVKEFSEAVAREIHIPLVCYAFDYYKAAEKFDTLLMINRAKDTAVFIEYGDQIKTLYDNKEVRLKPSALSLTSQRGGIVGVSIG